MYENCGKIKDRLIIDNNDIQPTELGPTYITDNIDTNDERLAVISVNELHLLGRASLGIEPINIGAGTRAHLDIGTLVSDKFG